MIQRVQTVWLLCGAVCMGCMIFMPVLRSLPNEFFDVFGKSDFGKSYIEESMYVAYVVVLSFTAFIMSVFYFKNRQGQLRVVRLNFLLIALVIVLLAFYNSNLMENLTGEGQESVAVVKTPAFFLTIPALVFNWLAARAIKKDEEVIRSHNRIR